MSTIGDAKSISRSFGISIFKVLDTISRSLEITRTDNLNDFKNVSSRFVTSGEFDGAVSDNKFVSRSTCISIYKVLDTISRYLEITRTDNLNDFKNVSSRFVTSSEFDGAVSDNKFVSRSTCISIYKVLDTISRYLEITRTDNLNDFKDVTSRISLRVDLMEP